MVAAPFPLVEIRSVANAQNEWVALLLRAAEGGLDDATLQAMFGAPDLLAAVAPLDCVVLLDSPAALTPPVLKLLPPNRVVLAVSAQALAGEGTARRLADLQIDGYRVLLDGALPAGVPQPAALRGVSRNFGEVPAGCGAPGSALLPALFGPHLARGVDSLDCLRACENAGFGWFSGTYALDDAGDESEHPGRFDDGTSRRRLLTMLALLSRDADSRELEAQLKQDPGLSYHLLKLVNSAAFSSGTHIASFGQAISRIGRRQLQRWLQLLLYARQHPDGPPNLLLPVAARRGALLEALCKRDGGDRDEQDLAFMTGVFSLLDRLFHMPMADLLRDLNLPLDVETALLAREGRLGQRLRLCEAAGPDSAVLEAAGVDGLSLWQAQLHAYHWAIQVARNV
ncbi:HDOD domain-containing protein [Massilia sp. LXY-6]|uniref:HDOD domain-containing protein n=1 Tax=Massilia sp. LXY-6 TaxID=3379823 RepID=UPI003EDEDD04